MTRYCQWPSQETVNEGLNVSQIEYMIVYSVKSVYTCMHVHAYVQRILGMGITTSFVVK